ncbi:unnamed protein product [Brachionus calyciflorus]|uniref:Ion transport domain-containing protein n=1 Tax=Brachionus calyciflorus TaxID=104777 RepID=A0A814L182_9BILA|nr:unnamed protein product [Brachionus calyciflorus]
MGIIQFYQTNGIIDIPLFVPIDVFYEELKYFRLDFYLDSNSKCDDMLLVTALKYELKLIKKNVIKAKSESNKALSESLRIQIKDLRTRYHRFKYYFDEDDDFNLEDTTILTKNKFQQKLWILLEKPNSSLLGRIIAFFGLLVVILSVAVMCLETVVESQNRSNSNPDDLELEERNILFFILELFCNSIFTIEIILRFIATSDKISFIKNFSNLIDFIAILPFWTILMLNNHNFLNFLILINLYSQSIAKKRQSNQYALSVLRILRLTRVLRVLKLSRHIQILNVMGKILYECVYEIILLLTFLTINIIIFSSLIYFIELDSLGENSPFISIPHSFWWAIISFTTIGYGDLIPQSSIGKFFGSFFILCGILIALLPVPILSCKFEKIYKECSHENRKKSEESESN